MAQRDTADQRRVERETDVEEATAVRSNSSSASDLNADVDSILDKIDNVLKKNAEDFIKSFVQKNGQ